MSDLRRRPPAPAVRLPISDANDLLIAMVEADRRLAPQLQGMPFHFADNIAGAVHPLIMHGGFPANTSVLAACLNELVAEQSIALEYRDQGRRSFILTREGKARYAALMAAEPLTTVEQKTVNYLATERFRQRYAAAYQRWSEAAALLWDEQNDTSATRIGHLVREATLEFADRLIELAGLRDEADSDRGKVKNRVRLVVERTGNQSESATAANLALLAYWESLVVLVQRQEHGSQTRALTWEDSRRVVFLTAVVFSEIDAACHQTEDGSKRR